MVGIRVARFFVGNMPIEKNMPNLIKKPNLSQPHDFRGNMWLNGGY